MKHIIKVAICLSLVLCALPSSLLAWNADGHRIVTAIAYQNLTPRARHQVDKVLGKQGMIYCSSWPDEIKSDTIYPTSYGWHFQNLRSGLSYAELDSMYRHSLFDGKHVFYAVDSLDNLLRKDKNNADALKFFVHLVGDEFQPMHMGHPEDRGGNDIKTMWFGSPINLHALWDGALISYVGYSYTEYAEFLMNSFASKKKAIEQMTMLECLHLTYDNQNAIYAYLESGDTNSYHYAYRFVPIMNVQLYTAGIKLAQMLNDIYR